VNGITGSGSRRKFRLTWQGATLLNFLGWAFVSLLILAFASPSLIRKQPGSSKAPDFHPLILWLGAAVLFATGSGRRGTLAGGRGGRRHCRRHGGFCDSRRKMVVGFPGNLSVGDFQTRHAQSVHLLHAQFIRRRRKRVAGLRKSAEPLRHPAAGRGNAFIVRTGPMMVSSLVQAAACRILPRHFHCGG
jgi:hypothetical protein